MDKKMQQCIANNLRYLRDYYDYTQEDVAALLHISRTTYGILESGTKNMRTDLLVRLARVYQVPVDLLMEQNYEKIARSVALSDAHNSDVSELLYLYRKLSPFSQGCLIEKAAILLMDEKVK